MIDWSIEAVSFGNCNCDYFCPCQFNQGHAAALKSAASTVGISGIASSTGFAMPCCMLGREPFTKETARCRR